ncbi:MAG: heme-binding protein [Pseudomonadota bacterium]|nr:MAG: heme-binding protein [Pseudomonadota bacterium]
MTAIVNKPALTLVAALTAIEAAKAQAIKRNWPVVIAVVDDGGHLIALHRLDNAQFGSVEIATAKARAAVAFKRPTKSWDDTLAGGRQAVLGLPGVVPAEGGVPIIMDGVVIGAVGVSGVTSPEDGEVAQAGVAALVK